jgi:hypothetical protein
MEGSESEKGHAQAGGSKESGVARKGCTVSGGEVWARSGWKYGRAETLARESRPTGKADGARSSGHYRTEAKSGHCEAAGDTECKLNAEVKQVEIKNAREIIKNGEPAGKLSDGD